MHSLSRPPIHPPSVPHSTLQPHHTTPHLTNPTRPQNQSWKARQQGYEELQKLLTDLLNHEGGSALEAQLKPWPEHFKKMTLDANAVAQEAALGAIQAYLTVAPTPLAIK